MDEHLNKQKRLAKPIFFYLELTDFAEFFEAVRPEPRNVPNS